MKTEHRKLISASWYECQQNGYKRDWNHNCHSVHC